MKTVFWIISDIVFASAIMAVVMAVFIEIFHVVGLRRDNKQKHRSRRIRPVDTVHQTPAINRKES